MGMPGSGSGPGKRAGRNSGTAPRADFHRPPASALVEFIDSHKDRFGVEPACAVLEIAPSTYYANTRYLRRAGSDKAVAWGFSLLWI